MLRIAGVVMVLTLAVPARAQDAAGVLMKKADRLYAKRAEGKAAEAVTAYEKVIAVDGKSVEARWKVARTYLYIGMRAAAEDAKLAAFEVGIRYAQDAVALDAKCAACQYYLGLNYGAYGEAKGMTYALGLLPHLQGAMNEVVKLDPGFDYSGAHRVLGAMYHRLPSIKGGDNGKAIEHLQRACADAPTHMANETFLAAVLLDEGRKEEARKVLETAIGVPEGSLPTDTVIDQKAEQALARRMYEKSFGPPPE